MAVTNPYNQGETTYQDTLFQQQGVIPGSTIPTGTGLTGATAGAPVVQPKPVATKTVAPTPLEVQKQTYQATQPQTPSPTQNVVTPDELAAQKLEYQAQQQQAATQLVSKSPAEQEATNLAVQQEQQKAAAQQQAATAMGSTTAPATSGQPATIAQQTGTTGGTATTQEVVQENPYQKQLETMKFDYNPQTDTQYLQDAAGLENQVVQMMTGRGGLYSSVAQSALQSRLVALQNDFRVQKYAQFVQDRNFLFDQSKQWFSEQATIWNQKQTEKEFAFAQEKEAFDQQMALAQYNLQVQAQQFSQAQARARAAAASNQALYQQQFDVAAKTLGTEQQIIQTNALRYSRESAIYKQYLERWKTSGVADSYVAKFFGVSQGASLSRSTSAITAKAAYLDSFKTALRDTAEDYNMSADLLDQVKMFQENKYISTLNPVANEAPTSSVSWLGGSTTQYQQTR